MSRVLGGQLTGRFAWPPQLIEAARRYTREGTEANLESLEEAKRAAAREVISLQDTSGFDYLTDGGVGMLDIFTPYTTGLEEVSSGGNINKYPGTRNCYYHTPVVGGPLKAHPVASRCLYTLEIKAGKKKAILPSPAALAFASESSHYSRPEKLMYAFAEVLREDVRDLDSRGYEMVQLTECFLNNDRFSKKVTKDTVAAFTECIETVFEGFGKRSCLYFHSGDASRLLPFVLETGITDVGFDFNTPAAEVAEAHITKNVLLGVQNTTRKLPEEWLEKEPKELASRARETIRSLKLGADAEVFLAPSQDYDGLQTYPQAKRRLENLAKAVALLKEESH